MLRAKCGKSGHFTRSFTLFNDIEMIMKPINFLITIVILISTTLGGCAPGLSSQSSSASGPIKILAVETFLADIAQNVAGERVKVESLLAADLDPHAFEPTPRDVAKIASSQVLITNGHGLEGWLDKLLLNADGQRLVIEASAGMASRTPQPGEISDQHTGEGQGDPHFWLDPLSVVGYVETIRTGLSQADPAGAETYAKNAAAYKIQLQDLDVWIKQQVAQIPAERRQLVTNHETFGYFADRYGFSISGSILSSVSSSASPSARQVAALIDRIRQSGAKAIFLETGTNPQLADQIASETGIRVITGLYTHSITSANGKAPTYIAMMKANTTMIVEALK
jgi:ABC-type Zn uptake system ZnuABC Zn-binding protein ZnuA